MNGLNLGAAGRDITGGPGLARAGRAGGGAFRQFVRQAARDTATLAQLVEVYARGDSLARRAWVQAVLDDLGPGARPVLVGLAGWEGAGPAATALAELRSWAAFAAVSAEAEEGGPLEGVALRADGPESLWLLVCADARGEVELEVRRRLDASVRRVGISRAEATEVAARLLLRRARRARLPASLARFASLFDAELGSEHGSALAAAFGDPGTRS